MSFLFSPPPLSYTITQKLIPIPFQLFLIFSLLRSKKKNESKPFTPIHHQPFSSYFCFRMADNEHQSEEPKTTDQPKKPRQNHYKPPALPLPPPSSVCDDYYHQPRDPRKTLCAVLTAILLLLAGLTVLILWLIYRPHKPQFTVVGAAVYDLNTTSPPLLSSSMQFTLLARNPNRRVSILYDKLTIHVSYRDQDITPPLALPPLHQHTKTTVSFSPVVGGPCVPVSMEVANGLEADQNYGVVALRVVIVGRVRWKAVFVRTKRYGFYMRCDVWVGLKRGFLGPVPLLGSPKCRVDV